MPAALRIILTPEEDLTLKELRLAHIGVGTGGFAPKALRDLGAHHVFATLDESGVREALFSA